MWYFEQTLQRWVSWSPVGALLNHSEVDAKIRRQLNEVSDNSYKMTCETHSNCQMWIDYDEIESPLRFDREDMVQVIQNLMSDQTTKEEILGLSE